MPSRARRCALVLALLAAFSASTAPAAAQAPSAEVMQSREAARALAEKGLDLFAANKLEEAIKNFELAEARFHAPTHQLFQARAYAKLGKLAKAKELYERSSASSSPTTRPTPSARRRATLGSSSRS